MTRSYTVEIECEHECRAPCFDACERMETWVPDMVNDAPKGWHVDYDGADTTDDEPPDYCGPCWAEVQSEVITPHKEGE